MSQEPRPSPYITLPAASDETPIFFHYSALVVCFVDEDGVTEVILRAGNETVEVWTKLSVTEVRALVEAASRADMSWT